MLFRSHLIRFKGGNAVTKILIRPQDGEALAKFPQITPSIDEFKEIQLPPKSNFAVEPEPIPTEKPKRAPQRRPAQKALPKPKVSRETVVIQREKKVRTPAVEPVVEKVEEPKPKSAPRKRAPRKAVQPEAVVPEAAPVKPKLSRESVIIPRERKTRGPVPVAPVEAKEPVVVTSGVKLSTPTPPRIRRGRPPVKKDL